MMSLIYRTHFDSAHRLVGYNGPCSNLHGHRWIVEIEIKGRPDPQTGMIIDFRKIKDLMAVILPDHKYLNEVFGIDLPTAENIAEILWADIIRVFPDLYSLTIWESDNAGAKIVKS